MRTFNVAWIVDQSLASLMGQQDIQIDLIIVDSGSTDKTLDMISHYQHTFIAIESKDYFPGKVLNQAIEIAKYDTIVFINSDVVLLNPYSLKNLISPLEHQLTAGSFGRQIVRPDADLWVRDDYECAFPSSDHTPKWMHYSLPIAAMKKSIWKKIPFYTNSWGSEDTYWGIQVKKAGYNIAYVKDAIAMHSHNYTLKQLASRRMIEGEADVYIAPNKKYTLMSMILTFIKSSLKKSWYYFINYRIYKIPYIIVNRAVYSWYYYKGFDLVYHKKSNQISYGDYQ